MDRTIASSAVGRNTFDLLPSLRTEAFTLKVNGFETGKHWYRLRMSSHATDDDKNWCFMILGRLLSVWKLMQAIIVSRFIGLIVAINIIRKRF